MLARICSKPAAAVLACTICAAWLLSESSVMALRTLSLLQVVTPTTNTTNTTLSPANNSAPVPTAAALSSAASLPALQAVNTTNTTSSSANPTPVGAADAAMADPTAGSTVTGDMPAACSTTGINVQTYCVDEISAAQVFFNVPAFTAAGETAATITEEQVQAYIAEAAAPTAGCCKAACEFNAVYCNCDVNVLAYTTQLAGGSIAMYTSVWDAFSRSCDYNLFLGPSCPSEAERESWPPNTCAPVVPTPAVQARPVNVTSALQAP